MTKTLQNSINFAEPLIQYSPLTAGKGQEPAVSTASIIRQTLLNPPNTWYFNRIETNFPLSKGVQDYLVALTDFGFIEKCSIADDQGNTWELKDVYNNGALAPATQEGRPNAIAIEGNAATTTLIVHNLVTVDITSNVATIVFDSVSGWIVGETLTLAVSAGPTFLNGQSIVIATLNSGTNTITANYTHSNWPVAASTLVATLNTAVSKPYASYDATTGKAVMFDLSSGWIYRVDCNGSTPVIDASYQIAATLPDVDQVVTGTGAQNLNISATPTSILETVYFVGTTSQVHNGAELSGPTLPAGYATLGTYAGAGSYSFGATKSLSTNATISPTTTFQNPACTGSVGALVLFQGAFAAKHFGGITPYNTAASSGGVSSPTNLPLPLSVTAGNIMLVTTLSPEGFFDSSGGGLTMTAVTDSQGNTYTRIVNISKVAGNSLTVWMTRLASSGSLTVTITFTGVAGGELQCIECTMPQYGLSNYFLNAGSVGYIDNTVYIPFYDSATGNVYINGLNDVSYALLNQISVGTGLSTYSPNVMRAWHYSGHSYLGAIYGGTGAYVMKVWDVTSYGSTAVFSDTFETLAVTKISGEGPYFFVDTSTGNIYVIYAYNSSSNIYTSGGVGAVAPDHWKVIQYTSTGTKTTWTFAADADGNCGTGGFFDATSGNIVVSCNKGAYKIFNPTSGLVTLTYGSASSPTYTSTQEYTGVLSGSEAKGLYSTGTQGFPEVLLGSTFTISSSHYFYGINTADTNTNQLIDVRDSSTLAVVATVDISTLIGGYSGISQYPGWTFVPSKNWLFVTDSTDSSHTYVLSLSNIPTSDSATGTGTFSIATTGPLFRFLAVPDQPYTAYLTYQKKPQPFGPYTVTGCGTASAGNTTYNGTFDPLTFPTGSKATINGFVTHTANNGTFTVVSCTSSQLIVANASGVAETVSAYAANFDWGPLPDWFVDVYNNLFLAEMLSLVDDARSQIYRQRGILAFLAKAEGLTDMQKDAFVQQWAARVRESASTVADSNQANKFRGV